MLDNVHTNETFVFWRDACITKYTWLDLS